MTDTSGLAQMIAQNDDIVAQAEASYTAACLAWEADPSPENTDKKTQMGDDLHRLRQAHLTSVEAVRGVVNGMPTIGVTDPTPDQLGAQEQ